jgi:hypothetical protein
MTVGILAYPLGPDFGMEAVPPRTIRWAYRKALRAKANPRPPEYMRELFAERYPEGRIESEPPPRAERIVLLYPDAVGLGFGALERRLPRGVPARVLNGRRRDFTLDRRTRAALLVRRALHRTMAGEAVFLLGVALTAPVLVAADLARGRR